MNDLQNGYIKYGMQTLVSEKLVMLIILINAGIFIALDIDPKLVEKTGTWLTWVDYVCVLYFAVELIMKNYLLGIKAYAKDHWNKLDFIIVIASIPILLEPLIPDLAENFGWAPVLRMTRLFRLARFLRFARLIRYVQRGDNLQSLKVPCYFLLLAVASNIVIVFLELSGGWKVWYDRFYGPSLLFIITWLTSRIYKALHQAYVIPYFQRSDTQVNEAIEAIVGALAQIFIWAIGITFTLELAGYNSASVLAGLGLGGMAVALAAQDTIGNLIGGLLLYLQRPFELGQKIQVSGHTGTVARLSLRSITLSNRSGELTSLPNKLFVSQPILNMAVSDLLAESIRLKMDINLSADKLEKAIDIIASIAVAYEHIDDEYTLKFSDMSDYCHNLVFEYYLNKKNLGEANPDAHMVDLVTKANRYLYVEIVRRLKENGIAFQLREGGLPSAESRDPPSSAGDNPGYL